jgi:hypothetical protein
MRAGEPFTNWHRGQRMAGMGVTLKPAFSLVADVDLVVI